MHKENWQHNPQWNGKFNWMNFSFLTITPALFVVLLPLCLYWYGFSWLDVLLGSVMTWATGLSITAGYHRLFSHQTYECSAPVRLFYLVFGAGAFQNTALKWSSDHRFHHRFTDRDGDPYNINKGFFWAHMGWIFHADPDHRSYDNVKDLQADPLVMWQDKYYLIISALVGLVLPTLIGYLMGRTLAGFVWGGLGHILVVHHGTFLINSAAHVYGTRPYSTKVSARDNWWLAFFTNGEGYHNFHHAFANDYRNGVRWYHWDPSKWLILTTAALGLSKNLSRTPEPQILKAKLENSYEQFRKNWQREVPSQISAMHNSLEERLREFQQEFRQFQSDRKAQSRMIRRKIRRQKRALERGLTEFRYQLQMTLKLET